MKSSGNGNNNACLYFIHRLDEIRGQKMYPFFDKGGNDNNGDFQLNIRDTQPQINKQLNFLLPFYGFGFNYTWLSLHGYLSFSESPVQVHSVSVYMKRCKMVTSFLNFRKKTILSLLFLKLLTKILRFFKSVTQVLT